ncbi:MAG TPA: tripartite tricarboxylate transporter permease [Symbiobacteriaceae bacterium]|nr:tripartite tricarboxylate transporter permease [Symbiobacteriaceae bacterium]
MEIFSGLMDGFAVTLSPVNLMFAFLGCLLGTAVGVLPGLGPAATISLLLPVIYRIGSPATAVIFLAGIYYGAMYGGSTTSILLNLPGEAASVVTTLDGYKMAQKGRAGAALGISAIGSFIAGTIGVLGLTLIAPPLAEFALKFGPPEYFALTLVGLLLAVFLSGSSLSKGLITLAIGLLLAAVGLDPLTGKLRFTLGLTGLHSGFEFVTLAMGVFGLGEIFYNLEQTEAVQLVTTKIGKLWPTLQDWAASRWAIFRGSVLGFFVGVLPGGGAVLSSLASYALEKRLSKQPEEFGQGAIAGVAGPESANNAASSASFIPLMTLGIPSNASIAMIYAALLIQGITPGPFLLMEHADVFWGVTASMYIGNIMLLALNLPLVGLWVQLLRVPFGILGPVVVLFTTVGVYSVANRIFDVFALIFFGILGYLLRKFKFEPGPLPMAFVLAPMIENSLRQSLLMFAGSPVGFVTRPISATLLAIFALLVAAQIVKGLRKGRKSDTRPGSSQAS